MSWKATLRSVDGLEKTVYIPAPYGGPPPVFETPFMPSTALRFGDRPQESVRIYARRYRLRSVDTGAMTAVYEEGFEDNDAEVRKLRDNLAAERRYRSEAEEGNASLRQKNRDLLKELEATRGELAVERQTAHDANAALRSARGDADLLRRQNASHGWKHDCVPASDYFEVCDLSARLRSEVDELKQENARLAKARSLLAETVNAQSRRINAVRQALG